MRRTTFALICSLLLVLAADAAQRRRLVEREPALPTYAQHIFPIFQQHCVGCHQPGGAGPFSLLSYETARDYRFLIKYMTETRRMPPWKAALDCGRWHDPNVLSTREIERIGRWADAGGPSGDLQTLPPPRAPFEGWILGEPDLVLRNEDSFEVDEMADSWRCYVFDPDEADSRYLAGVEVLNDPRETVHHMIAYLDTSGQAAALDASDPGAGYDYEKYGLGFEPAGVVGLYTPGERPFLLPDGIAIELPENTKIVLQVHYHPHAHHPPGSDRPRIGLHYANSTVQKRLGFMAIYNGDLFVPANQKDVLVEATQQIDEPISVRTMGGHMHYLGQRMLIRSVQPDGTEQCLLRIDQWDQRWQGMYPYREPVKVPAGSEIVVQGWYDNTSGNALNPHDPPRDIYWGEAAEDEMLQGYLTFTRDLEDAAIEP